MADEAGSAGTTRRGELVAILFVLAESAIYTVIFSSEKLLGDQIPVLQLQFFRFFISLLLVLAFFVVTRHRLMDCKSRHWPMHLLRGFLAVAAGAAALQAPLWAPLLDVTAVQMLDGLIAVTFGVLFLRERLLRRHWLGSALLLVGAVTVVFGQGAFGQGAFGQGAFGGGSGIDRSEPFYWAGLGLSALVALLFASQALVTRVLAQRDGPLVMLLYLNIIASLMLLGPALWVWTWISFWQLFPYLLLGPLNLLAQYFYVRACALAPISLIGPVEYSRLIFAGLLGLLFFQQLPSLVSLIGAALLVTGGVILARR
ncbi:MAG: DMT family transporter [Kiloniellales bacterium]